MSARAIGAANTLSFGRDGAIAAENTDAPGLLAALDSSVQGVRALVLGAGGSARAAAWALAQAGAGEVSIWNRTPERARALARELGLRAVSEPGRAELLVNCTSVGLAPPADGDRAGREAELAELGLSAGAVGEYQTVVDLVYRADAPTALVQAALEHGARTVDGLEVLVRQGALSLRLWTGREAPLQAMRRAAPAPPSSNLRPVAAGEHDFPLGEVDGRDHGHRFRGHAHGGRGAPGLGPAPQRRRQPHGARPRAPCAA